MNRALPEFMTGAIEVSAVPGVELEIQHGLGRSVLGWLVIWKTSAIDFYATENAADVLRLMPYGSTGSTVRFVLL